MSDQLINQLVEDLSPRKPMKNSLAWGLAICAFIGLSAFVILSHGLRADFAKAVGNGTIAWKNGGLILGALASLIGTIELSRPDTRPRRIMPGLFIAIFAIITWRFLELKTHSPLLFELSHINFGGAQTCLSIISIGGIGIFGILWYFWLRKAASKHPQYLGAIAGLMSALIAGSAYSFHCNMDNIFYYLTCYWLPAFGLSGLGFLLGSRLRW